MFSLIFGNKHEYSYHAPIFFAKIGPRRVKLLEDTEIFGVLIPKDYISNGLSVPRFLWNILSPFTEGFRAGLVHDYRYSYRIGTRAEADWEFFINLLKCNINVFKAYGAYLAVRMFGGSRW
jgi:hypothetical protein